MIVHRQANASEGAAIVGCEHTPPKAPDGYALTITATLVIILAIPLMMLSLAMDWALRYPAALALVIAWITTQLAGFLQRRYEDQALEKLLSSNDQRTVDQLTEELEGQGINLATLAPKPAPVNQMSHAQCRDWACQVNDILKREYNVEFIKEHSGQA